MKIVIDIPDYNLDEVQNGSIACGVILKAVKNGVILPKGHGDLIDRTAILNEMAMVPITERNFNSCVECVECMPAIINANNKEKE